VTRLQNVSRAIRARVLDVLFDSALERHGSLPTPVTPPHVHAMGANPDRLLIIGAAAVAGSGVTDHELGLTGRLARHISTLTGRGVDLDIVGRYTMTVDDARELVASLDLERYDGVILALGSREAARLTSRTSWNRSMNALLDDIATRSHAGLLTFLVEIPPVHEILELNGAVGAAVRDAVIRLNDATATSCRTRMQTHIVPFSPKSLTGAHFGSTLIYEDWAKLMAPAIAIPLMARCREPRAFEPVDEQRRVQALDELQILDTPRDERFERLVRMARDGLGVTGAAMNFIDGDRQWTKASASLGEVKNTDRVEAFCATTIQRPELFVVEDLARDPDFADFDAVTGELGLRFYAGYPVESPDGQRVGALCVVDTHPRQLSEADAALLRELALRAQDLVWSLAR
jgi:hypothetical protein